MCTHLSIIETATYLQTFRGSAGSLFFSPQISDVIPLTSNPHTRWPNGHSYFCTQVTLSMLLYNSEAQSAICTKPPIEVANTDKSDLLVPNRFSGHQTVSVHRTETDGPLQLNATDLSPICKLTSSYCTRAKRVSQINHKFLL